jgi:type IV pilus assembly protein PilC
MPVFAYEARREDGELVTGMVTATDMGAAGLKLAEKDLYIVKLASADREENARAAASNTSKLKVKRQRVVWFVNQLSIMVETGITIGEALDCLARQSKDPESKKVLEGISASVHEGRPLSDSMEMYPRTFPKVMVAMIRAAEHSGMLGTVLSRTAAYMLKEQQIMRKFKSALMYPGFMLLMCVGVTVFLMTAILPKFAGLFAAKGAALPAPTRILMGINGIVASYWPYLLGGILALGSAIYVLLRSPTARPTIDAAQLRTPVLGNVLNKHQQARFFRTAAMLLDAGVPLSDVLALVKAVSTNVCYARLWARVEEGVKNGETLTTRLRESPYLSEVVVQMVDCGDRSGRLGQVLTRLADVLEDEFDEAVKTMAQFIEPLMIVVMGSIIGFIAISLLLPMFKASTLVK